MDEVNRELPVRHPLKATGTSAAKASWLSWFRVPWFPPLASAAAVAVAFLTWNHYMGGATADGGIAQTLTYAPDPNVVANSYYSAEAEATVIDLQNLPPVPNSREIRASDVAASAEPVGPGQPEIFYAASDATRPVFIRSSDAFDNPSFVAAN
jgi:hypothetical protein